MPAIRIDPLTGLRTIIAPDRHLDLSVAPPDPIDPADDPFAEGHEDRTAAELYAVREDGAPDSPGWSVRVVPGAVLTPDSPDAEPDSHADLFAALPARGSHETIVNSPAPVVSLSLLTVAQVGAAIDVWRERMRVHSGAAYQHLSVDERAEAGASPPHTHAQLHAITFVPAMIARERERFTAYAARTMGGNLLEDLVQEEVRRRERIVAIDDEAVLLSPYAARTPFQLMLVPRRRRERFQDDGPTGAALLHDALSRLRGRFGAPPPLSLWVRTAPRDADRFCWRIDIVPRLSHAGGLDLGTGMHRNPVAPEQAADELR